MSSTHLRAPYVLGLTFKRVGKQVPNRLIDRLQGSQSGLTSLSLLQLAESAQVCETRHLPMSTHASIFLSTACLYPPVALCMRCRPPRRQAAAILRPRYSNTRFWLISLASGRACAHPQAAASKKDSLSTQILGLSDSCLMSICVSGRQSSRSRTGCTSDTVRAIDASAGCCGPGLSIARTIAGHAEF